MSSSTRVVRPQVLNAAFLEAAKEAKQKLPELTHSQKVARLYRKSLKTLSSWAVDRQVFLDEATALRARFDANRNASSAHLLLQQGQDELFQYTHPDPYCVPYMPGGSLFMRNPPIPLEVCFPDGNYPADAPKHTLNPDMTVCKPETGKSAVGSVLVDFTKKNME